MNATERTWEAQAEEIGRCAMDSIREMVAALECDYDRLEELKGERDDWEAEIPEDFAVTPLDDDDEAKDRATCGTCGRSWDDAIATEYTPAPSGRCPFEAYHETWAEANPDEAEELKELEEAAGECESREDAEQRIMEDPLSLQVRSGWCSSKEDMEPEEFELLLSTGGPAVRIIGEIDRGQASKPRLQVQDWFKPWTNYNTDSEDDAALETYCNCFCFEQ
jgi:hypothetical protein